MQQLNVQLSIPIPADSVIISRVEYDNLKQQELSGVYWTMKDIEQRIQRSIPWIKENILYPPRFKAILDSEQGGFVYYPKSQGQSWSFQATKMASFLDKYFAQIFAQ